MSKKAILGSGTEQDPYYYEKSAKLQPPMKCPDGMHDLDKGFWFLRPTPKAKRCPWCTSERPAESTLRFKQKFAERAARRATETDATEREAFRYFRRWLDKVREDAKRLRDDREEREFGIYGRIKATDREIRLAELEAVTLANDPTPVTFLSMATGLTVTEIEALRAGAGSNPDYPSIQHYYQLRGTRRDILAIIKDYKATLKELPALDRLGPYKEILKMEDKLIDLLPKPKKREQLDFGDRENTAAEALALRAVSDFCLCEPPQDSRLGGPGPLR